MVSLPQGKELWMREVVITISTDKEKAMFSHKVGSSDNFEIHFDIPFSDAPTPSEATVTLFNLNETSVNKIKKGAKVTIVAGYRGDTGVLSEGTITNLQPTTLAGVDRQTSFTFLEGTNYADKKEVDITFAKGTAGATIINRVASTAGIPISAINLKNNKVYGSGYTADGDAMSVLEEVVKFCESSIYYKRGKLVIRDIKAANTDICNVNHDSGLIGQPSRVESDDYSGWSLESLLQHRISTATTIKLTSKNAKGTFFVKSGSHSFNGSSLSTKCEVIS